MSAANAAFSQKHKCNPEKIMQTFRPHIAALSLFVALLLLALPLPALALTPSEVFEQVKDSVFVVKTFDAKGKQKGLGSAVLLPTGKIATNCHVVEDGARFEVGRNKQFSLATLYASDHDKDICLLDTKDTGGKPAQLGKAASLKVGVPVYAVGAPQGLELSLSDGIVSQLRGGKPPMIQTTAAISPGSSGGGLFDGEARLVGFTTLYIDGGQNLNFAMPVEWLAEIKPDTKVARSERSQADWLKRAIALEKRKDWPGLLDWGRQWAKADPKNADAWFVLGKAYGKLNRPSDAIDAYRQSLSINQEDSGVWNNLGTTYLDLNRPNDALDAFRRVLLIDPEDSMVWYNLGITYSYTKRFNDAIKAYHQALRSNPEHPDIWNNLAVAYHFAGNRSAALDAVKILQRLDPERAERIFNLIVPR